MTTVASTVSHRVTPFDGRVASRGARRRAASGIALGLGVAGTAGGAVIATTLAAAWIVSIGLSGNPSIRSKASAGPGALAIVQVRQPATASPAPLPSTSRAADMAFAARWTDVTASVTVDTRHAPNFKQLAALIPTAKPDLPKLAGDRVPLPRAHPLAQERAAAQVAAAPSPLVTGSIPTDTAKLVHNKSMALPGPESRTAVYDIVAQVVHMPNGEKLEAHSGLGDKMDNPRFVNVRMRGSTPPNVYDLTLRKSLFHGVQAIRLNPVDRSSMFGRDGILAHSYMLGPNGQSNGCVSFKDYPKFLNAFMKGEVDRIVVVSSLGDGPLPAIETTRTARAPGIRRWHVASSTPTPDLNRQDLGRQAALKRASASESW